MQRKSLVITAALVTGLALGIVLGPAARGTIASAQTEPTAQSQTTPPGGTLWNLFLDKLAGTLGIQRSALDTAITNAGNSTADAAVQQGTLMQEQADATYAQLQQQGSQFLLRPGRGFGGRRGHGGGFPGTPATPPAATATPGV